MKYHIEKLQISIAVLPLVLHYMVRTS